MSKLYAFSINLEDSTVYWTICVRLALLVFSQFTWLMVLLSKFNRIFLISRLILDRCLYQLTRTESSTSTQRKSWTHTRAKTFMSFLHMCKLLLQWIWSKYVVTPYFFTFRIILGIYAMWPQNCPTYCSAKMWCTTFESVCLLTQHVDINIDISRFHEC